MLRHAEKSQKYLFLNKGSPQDKINTETLNCFKSSNVLKTCSVLNLLGKSLSVEIE